MADHATCLLRSTLTEADVAKYLRPGEDINDPEVLADVVARSKETTTNQAIKDKINLAAEARFMKTFVPNVDKIGAQRSLRAALGRELSDEGRTVGIEALSRGYQRRVGMILDEPAETFHPTVTGGQRNTDILRDVVDMLNGKERPKFEQSYPLFEAMRKGEQLMLKMYRQVGGEVRTLDNWFPQTHNSRMVQKRGQEGWKDFVRVRLDDTKMRDRDGNQMKPEQIDEMLDYVWGTITTSGASKAVMPAFLDPAMGGPFKERQSMARVLHFEDSTKWMEYHDEFGQGDLWGNFTNHLHQMATDTAAMRMFGTDPSANFTKYLQYANKSDSSWKGVPMEAQWRNIMGFDTQGENAFVNITRGARDIISSAYMGSAVLASIPDIMTTVMNAGMNDLDIPRMLAGMNEFADPKARKRMAQAAGDIEWANSSMAQNLRFEENMGTGMARRLSDANYRMGGMNAWTDRWRHVHQREFLRKFAEESGKTADKTTPGFKSFLDTYGLADDWDTIRAAGVLEDGSGVMNLSTLTDDHLIAKVLGALDTERDLAMLTPDARVRATLNLGLPPGTAAGEGIRLMGQFKTFPATMIMHGIGRYFLSGRLDRASKATYIAGMTLGMTALGAVSYQLKELSKGHDPVDMDSADFWIKSLGYGGALPGVVEILVDGQTRHGRSPLEAAAGPVGGAAGDLYRMSVGTGVDWIQGEDWEANLAKGVEKMSRLTPGQSLWWGRVFAERILRDSLMNVVDDNYLNRQRQKQGYLESGTGQEEFWEFDGTFGGSMRAPQAPAPFD